MGMSLVVPPLSPNLPSNPIPGVRGRVLMRQPPTMVTPAGLDRINAGASITPMEISPPHDVKYDPSRHEVRFEDTSQSPVRHGDWVNITSAFGTLLRVLLISTC